MSEVVFVGNPFIFFPSTIPFEKNEIKDTWIYEKYKYFVFEERKCASGLIYIDTGKCVFMLTKEAFDDKIEVIKFIENIKKFKDLK